MCGPVAALAALPPVKIGVLSHRGAEAALSMWRPTADYLTSTIPPYSFTVVPLGFQEIGPAVERGEVDFVLVNSSIYVTLEARFGVSRIATLRNRGLQGGQTVFGGVIFCRADRSDINTIGDLKGKSFLAVDETSLGGWQVAWRELKESGLDPYRDFGGLRFTGSTHDDVVYAIRDRKADAGTVRSDTLESLAAAGKIELGSFRILNQRRDEGFPFLLSTRLYPEWPLAMCKRTNRELAEQVAIALFNLPPESPAAKAGQNLGWTIALDYQPVHELMRELRLGPYKDYGKITLADVLRLYWYWIALAVVALVVMLILTLRVIRLNTRLTHAKQLLEEAHSGLEQEVLARTDELRRANEELRKSEKYLRDVTATLGEGIFVLDLSGKLTFMNPAAERLLGWSESELLQKEIHLIVHNRGNEGGVMRSEDCRIRNVTEIGRPYCSEGEFFAKKDGTVFPVSVNSAPLMEDGQVVASVTVFIDISERKRLDQEREKLVAELQAALADIKTLHGIVPICAACKKIRDDEGAWHQLESYISQHTEAQFSHGLCKECAHKLYPEYRME
jgi:two-component system sensor histidine kinase TtrS